MASQPATMQLARLRAVAVPGAWRDHDLRYDVRVVPGISSDRAVAPVPAVQACGSTKPFVLSPFRLEPRQYLITYDVMGGHPEVGALGGLSEPVFEPFAGLSNEYDG
jgi:hypothetical protein